MKTKKYLLLFGLLLLISSCGQNDKRIIKQPLLKTGELTQYAVPLDKGFSEYISGFTSGIIPANSAVEIRFTREFADKARKQIPPGLFTTEPFVKGDISWTDELTLVFRPSKVLDPGKTYAIGLNLYKLANVKDRLRVFPITIQTLKKDFSIVTGTLESHSAEGNKYVLNGEIVASDYIDPEEVVSYLDVKLEKKKMDIAWDHSENLVHRFTIGEILRTDKPQELVIKWDGTAAGVNQKGSTTITIPALGDFSVLGVKTQTGEDQRIDILFSDPVDESQELDGLIYIENAPLTTISASSNIVSLIPSSPLQNVYTLFVESSVKNAKGANLSYVFSTKVDFSAVNPAIKLVGNGVILPSSQNLIFPFRAANLKAVDLKIIKIFENNLPYFLQENNINTGNYVKRFGRPVYSGRIDLLSGTGTSTGSWNLYTIDLADYIDVEPGVLYKVQLGMRMSYSLFPCTETGELSRYEEYLQRSQELSQKYWEDPENYYDDSEDAIYYSFGFSWRDRDNPCKEAFYSPDKNVSRNILASNLGLTAKIGEDNILHVIVSDLLTALPVSEVSIDVFDYQMQQIVSGNTNQDGFASLHCERKPFLLIAKKDRDRNYLKVNDGSSLSLSSFDVSGVKPEKGIKAFVYGERDVWRPGDSIFLSVFIKDMTNGLPPDHPVQFELINPLEQKVDNQIQKLEGKNLLVFTTRTSPDAVTGNYRAVIKIGGASFTERVRVETIKPNRLKIALTFPNDILGGTVQGATGKLNAKWLNGSMARNLRTSVEYILKHTKTEFEKYSQYIFDDPVAEFYSETVSIFDDAIDENGDATIKFDPGRDLKAPGMLSAVFTAKVQEQGGDESIIQTTYKYAPYSVFAGISLPGLKGKSRMLFTDTDNEVKVVTVNEKGNPVNSMVEMTIYKLSYRWWWESDRGNLAYYISSRNYKPVITKTITTSGGEGSFSFNINRKDWGRYLVRVSTPGGHSTGKMLLVDWPWEYGMKENAEGATLLAVSTDKEKYNPGDDIKLSFPTPENAMAIITLENATGILDEIRTPTTRSNTEVRIKARPEMAPNVYAFVSVVQPHSQSINDMPVRLYGIVPVMVEDPETRLTPIIIMPDEVRSQKSFRIEVSEENRKGMTYTLAVVDEGLLDITGFKTPDPWNYFYAREALGVQTWDLYDYVLGAYGGTLERIFAIGGDEALADRSANKAQRFIPVVRFLGPFTLDQGKTNSHRIMLPQYTGSVKTMVIAGTDRAFGAAEKTVFVKDPLMVLVTAPRVISPGEKAALPVTLFIQKDNIKNVSLQAECNDLIRFEEAAKNISVTEQGEKDTELTFIAGEKTGIATIRVTASGGGETAVYELELDIRSPNPPESRAEMRMLKPGEKWETSFKPFGIAGSNSAHLEISALPSVNLEKRLDYLLNYPHGCSEQITSAAFPQLWLKNLAPGNQQVIEESSFNIKEAINKLIARQMGNGGIALWPGSYQPDNWVTSFTGHFMLEAERLGYNIPSGFRNKWISYQRKAAQEWRYDSRYKYTANDQAYRLFTLALAGQPEKAAMNRLRESAGIPRLSKWLLAAAFATSGRSEVAGNLLDLRSIDTEPEYYGYYYGSQIRDKAIVLYTLTVIKSEEQALPLLKEICDNLSTESWYSTQSLAWGLFAYMKWVEMIPDADTPVKVAITLNGSRSDQSVTAKQRWSENLRITEAANSLIVENTSGTPAYATLTRKGIPLVSDVLKEEKGINMMVEYLNMDLKPVDQKNLIQGYDFMMVVKVTNSTFSHIENIALNQMVPSGWEIQNTRLFEANRGIKESQFDYRDFRDDRVYTYFDLNPGDTKTFVLVLNAAYKGEFFQPSIWCEAMYTDNCYARQPGTRVKVISQ